MRCGRIEDHRVSGLNRDGLGVVPVDRFPGQPVDELDARILESHLGLGLRGERYEVRLDEQVLGKLVAEQLVVVARDSAMAPRLDAFARGHETEVGPQGLIPEEAQDGDAQGLRSLSRLDQSDTVVDGFPVFSSVTGHCSPGATL